MENIGALEKPLLDKVVEASTQLTSREAERQAMVRNDGKPLLVR